jgi:VHL beta domain
MEICLIVLAGVNLDPPVLCFLAGIVIFVVAAIGGGVTIKDWVVVPVFTSGPRWVIGLLGLVVMGFGGYLIKITTPRPTPPKVDAGISAQPPTVVPPRLEPLNCNVALSLRSGAVSQPVLASLLFINKTTAPVTGFWIDYDGQKKEWFRLGPSENVTQQTYEGHPWEVDNQAGQCVALFLPSTSDSTAEIVNAAP